MRRLIDPLNKQIFFFMRSQPLCLSHGSAPARYSARTQTHGQGLSVGPKKGRTAGTNFGSLQAFVLSEARFVGTGKARTWCHDSGSHDFLKSTEEGRTGGLSQLLVLDGSRSLHPARRKSRCDSNTDLIQARCIYIYIYIYI